MIKKIIMLNFICVFDSTKDVFCCFFFLIGMTLPKSISCCPVCQKPYLALSKHLQRVHAVRNAVERGILINLASNRVNIRKEACPVLSCSYNSSRLDSHLSGGRGDMESKLAMVMRTKFISLLVALRSTSPAVQMATGLNLEVNECFSLSLMFYVKHF